MKIATKLLVTAGIFAALFTVHLWQGDSGLRRQRDERVLRHSLQASDARMLNELELARANLEAVLTEPEPQGNQWSTHLQRGREALLKLSEITARAAASPRLGAGCGEWRAALQDFSTSWARYERFVPDLDAAAATTYRLRELAPPVRERFRSASERIEQSAARAAMSDHVAELDALDRERRTNFITFGLICAAVISAAVYWHRLLIGPLRRMAADALDINAGRRLDIRHPYRSSDEIAALGLAFNNALESVKSNSLSRSELETLVAQRTAELARSDASLHRVIEASGLGFWEWDIVGQRMRLSGCWNELLGYRFDTVEQSFATWEEFIHPDDRAATLIALQAHLAGELSHYEIEHRMTSADGRWKWILTRGLVVDRDAAGRATRVAGTHADIHARRIAEEELRRREEQLRQLADNLPEGALYQFVASADGFCRNTYVGEGCSRILGLDPATLLGKRGGLHEQLAADDASAFVAASNAAIRDRRPFRGECRVRSAAGETKWLSFRAHPRAGSESETVWDGVMLDFTAAKTAEVAIARQVEFLAALNEMTLDLLNRRDKETLLQTIVERTARLLEAPHVELSLLESDNTLITRACVGRKLDTRGDQVSRSAAPFSWSAIDTRAPRIVEDYSAQSDARSLYVEAGVHAVAVFPILHGQACLGVLGFARLRRGQAFTEDEIGKGRVLAQLVALVLHNSSIYEHAIRIAEARTQDLRDNEWRLREAQRIAHIGHWEYSFEPGNKIERWSDETYRIFGLEPQSVTVDRTLFDRLVHPEDLPRFREQVSAVWDAPRRIELDYRIVRPDGCIRHIHEEGEPRYDVQGRVVGMQGIVQDVTERHEAEAALRDRERLYRSLVETIDHGYYIANFRSLFTYTNPALEAMGGFSAGELIGKSSFRLIAEQDRVRVMQDYRRWRDDPEIENVQCEFRVTAKNGRVFWVEQSTHFMRDATGRVKEGRNVLRDISERRTTEAALREREERFRSVFDLSPIPIVLSSVPDGAIVAANAAAERTFGYSAKDAIGRTTVELGLWITDEDRAEFLALLFERGSVTGLEVRMRNRAGETLRMLYSGSIVHLSGRTYALSSILDVTAQKRAEDSLRESELRFKRVVENIGDALMVDDVDGRIVFANDRFLEMFRCTRAEVAQRTIFDLMVPENRETARAVHETRLLGGDAPSLFEAEAVRGDGTRFWIEVRVTAVLENGRAIGSQAALRDITERRLIDRTLRLLSTGTAQLTGASFYDYVALRLAEILSLEGCIIASRGAFGWKTLALNLDGKLLKAHAPEATEGTLAHAVLAQLGAIYAATIVGGFPRERQLAELGVMGCAVAPLLSGSGEVIGFVALLSRHEIANFSNAKAVLHLASVRIAAEIARGRNERQFQDLFEFAPDAIVMISADGGIVRTNQRVEKLFGCPGSILVGQHLSVLIPDANRTVTPRLRAIFADAQRLADTRTQLTALEARRRDGFAFPVELSLGAVETESGTQVAAAIRDITEQRIAEARLRQAQKMEALGTLAGGIAHDFNNLLTGIFGFVELSRGELPPKHPARPWLDNISAASRRARNLVQQILTFSRQNEGERTPVDVASVVTEAVQLLRSTLPPMVHLEDKLGKDAPRVLADATQLHQAVMNLCTNAWHALPESGGRIRVEVEAVKITDEFAAEHPGMPRGTAVRVAVIDNGSGIPSEIMERIFDPFFTTKPAGKGTGLGLAVVHGVVRAHGGAITVQSKPREGTKFEIFLPAIETTASDTADTATLRRGCGERILLVDDEPIGRTALAALLEHLGYSIDHFEQPETAVTHFAIAPGTYALVMTDFAMPGMTGVELTRAIRQIRPDIPVLLISGYIETNRLPELEEAGVTLFLRKPPTLDEVAQAVARCIASRANPPRAST